MACSISDAAGWTRRPGSSPSPDPVQLLDVHAQDLREAQQDAVAVDATLAALDLGQPRLGPADQPGEHSL